MKVFVLILYLGTFDSKSGVSLTSAEFTSEERCQRAGDEAKKKIAGLLTVVRFVCAEK